MRWPDRSLPGAQQRPREEQLRETLGARRRHAGDTPHHRAANQDVLAAPAIGPVPRGQRKQPGDEHDRERQQTNLRIGKPEVFANAVQRNRQYGAVQFVDCVQDEEDDERPHPGLPQRLRLLARNPVVRRLRRNCHARNDTRTA